MNWRKTVLVVTGSLFALVAMGLLIAGGVLMGISETRSDPDGYLTSPTFELSTDTHALTSEQLDLGAVRNDWLPASWLATVKVSAASLVMYRCSWGLRRKPTSMPTWPTSPTVR
jgi:hypothetical protein